MIAHTILELRTSKDSLETAEAAAQIFATLPTLRRRWWHRLLAQQEELSFEILVVNQVIRFLIYTPTRLSEYLVSIITASYPQVLITPLLEDPVAGVFHPTNPQPTKVGVLKLRHTQYLPLKIASDFKEVDPLAPLLVTMAKTHQQEAALFQILIGDDNDRWKLASPGPTNDQPHPQQALIDKKLGKRCLNTSLRVLAMADSTTRARQLLEHIASSVKAISQSEGNELFLPRITFFPRQLEKLVIKRRFGLFAQQHLSIDELATLYHFPNKQLSSLPNIAWGKTLLGQPPEDLPVLTKDMSSEAKGEINAFARTVFKNELRVYGIKRADRRRHMYVIGKTGTGKSTLLANMAINDLKNNEGLCVIDPHGDLVETLLEFIPSHRINDVVYFNPVDGDRTVKINLFEGENVQHRELIASGIVSVFQKLYSYSWGPRLEYILRNALLTLLKSPEAKLSDILELLTNAKFRDRIIEKLDDPILKSYWVNEFNQLKDRQRQESIAPILNKVGQFVSSPLVRNVVNTTKSTFSIEDIMSQGKILLVNLSQGKLGEDNATLIGAMLITKIQLAAMARVNVAEEQRRDFYLYVDEFQNFATDSFIKILSEARKYRLNLTLANQYIAQIPEEVQKAIFGNCGNIVSFVMGADDAQVFQREYSGLYTDDDLVSLGKYQIINKISIDNVLSSPFPANTLELAKSRNQNRDKVIRVSRERYATKRQ